MAELAKVRCAGGHLIVTDTHIILERRMVGSRTMLRSAVTGVDYHPPVLWRKASLTFHAAGDVFSAEAVKSADAEQVRALLTGR